MFLGGLRLQRLQAMDSAMNQINHESRTGDSRPTILLVPELGLACRKHMGLLFPELINYHNCNNFASNTSRTFCLDQCLHFSREVIIYVISPQKNKQIYIYIQENLTKSSIRTQPHSKMIQKANCLKIRRKKTRVQNLFTLGFFVT